MNLEIVALVIILGCSLAGGHVLVVGDRREIIEYNTVSNQTRILVNGGQNLIALDMDFRSKELYFSDVTHNKLYKVQVPPTGSVLLNRDHILLEDGVYVPDGMALDWINKNLYWTDEALDTISVLSLTTNQRVTLLDLNFEKPRGIVVDPRLSQRWMYWTDWGEQAYIDKAGLDGSNRQRIVNTNLGFPNGLTIDFTENKLYWIDAVLHSISTCDFDGENKAQLFQSDSVFAHPFGIDIFENTIYWTDWQHSAVIKADAECVTGCSATTL